MNHYKNFYDWFNQDEILVDWLKTAWDLGYRTGKNGKA